jgi:hypothetical protein
MSEVLNPWATMGILGRKGKTKATSSGKPFDDVTLTDLVGTSISLFVFGKAFQEHWKESEGTLLAVFDAKVRHTAPPPSL